MADDMEKEVRDLRERLLALEVEFRSDRRWLIITGILLLGILGYTNFVALPNEVKSQLPTEVKGQIDKEAPERVQAEFNRWLNANQQSLTAAPPRPSSSEASSTVRAGTAAFAIGQDGINITFSSPMPNTRYAVVVQATNTAGYSPVSVCTYFNPLHKRDDGFEVQHKRCDDGVPVELDVDVALDWIVVAYK